MIFRFQTALGGLRGRKQITCRDRGPPGEKNRSITALGGSQMGPQIHLKFGLGTPGGPRGRQEASRGPPGSMLEPFGDPPAKDCRASGGLFFKLLGCSICSVVFSFGGSLGDRACVLRRLQLWGLGLQLWRQISGALGFTLWRL